MRAFQITTLGKWPELTTVADPRPGAGAASTQLPERPDDGGNGPQR